jgi:hypothetical protein
VVIHGRVTGKDLLEGVSLGCRFENGLRFLARSMCFHIRVSIDAPTNCEALSMPELSAAYSTIDRSHADLREGHAQGGHPRTPFRLHSREKRCKPAAVI